MQAGEAMSEWRPGDWENPYGEVAVADDFDKEPTMLLSLRPVFEAGADAIVAALREEAKKMSPEEWLKLWYPPTTIVSDEKDG